MLYILLARKPILTFNTDSYHFCKLSLAKPTCLDQTGHVPNKPMDSSATALEESQHPYHPEEENALTVEALSGNSKEIVQRCPTESSIQVNGLYLFAYCSMLSLYTYILYELCSCENFSYGTVRASWMEPNWGWKNPYG